MRVRRHTRIFGTAKAGEWTTIPIADLANPTILAAVLTEEEVEQLEAEEQARTVPTKPTLSAMVEQSLAGARAEVVQKIERGKRRSEGPRESES